MSDVTFHREHTLGLDRARVLAKEWVNSSARQLGLTCQYQEGAEADTISFERMGVHGTMTVTGSSFDLLIKLGMMMAPLRPLIEAEVSRNLGRIIDKASGQA